VRGSSRKKPSRPSKGNISRTSTSIRACIADHRTKLATLERAVFIRKQPGAAKWPGRVGAVNDTPAAQTASRGNVSVQVVWPPAAGAYEQPGMDLRIKNRNAFAIALLLCPR
jgi:hypothetical protein